jgi:hypothetical protein
MFCVVASFVIGDVRVLKVFGLGLAVAVLVDATPRVGATAGQPNVLDLALPHDEPSGEQHDHVDEEPGEAAGATLPPPRLGADPRMDQRRRDADWPPRVDGRRRLSTRPTRGWPWRRCRR